MVPSPTQRWKRMLFFTVLLLGLSGQGYASIMTLRWDAISLPDLAGYRIYYKFETCDPPYVFTGVDQGPSPIMLPLSELNDPENPEYTLTGLEDSLNYFFIIRPYDSEGNEGSASEEISNAASDNPLISIDTPINTSTPMWNWVSGGSGNRLFRYKLDNGQWVETANTFYTPATALTEGSHTLVVQEQDHEGKWSGGSAYSIQIDLTPPLAPVVSGITPTGNSTPVWSWVPGGGGMGLFRYKIDDSDFASGTVETTDTFFIPEIALSEGSHTLYVQEQDEAGNWSVPTVMALMVDIPPNAPMVTGPGKTAAPAPTWLWTSGGGGNCKFRFKLDNDDLTTGATIIHGNAYTPSAPLEYGRHTLYVEETDEGNNWSKAGQFTIIIDPTASPAVEEDVHLSWNPSMQIGNHPAEYRIYYTTGFSGPPYTGTGIDQGPSPVILPFEDLIDPENPEIILTGLDTTAIYFFAVTAKYANENESSYSNQIFLAPAILSDKNSSSSSYTNNTTVNLSLAGISCTTMEMLMTEDMVDHINSTGWAPFKAQGTFTFSNFIEGENRIFVKFRNMNGNESGWAKGRIIIDTTPPTSIISAPDYGNGSVSVNCTASDGPAGSGVATTELWYKKEVNGLWQSTGLPLQPGTDGTFSFTPGNGEGSYYFAASSTDQAGNKEVCFDGTEIVHTIMDTTAPTIENMALDFAAHTLTLIYSEDPIHHASEKASYRFAPGLEFASVDIDQLAGNVYRLPMAAISTDIIYTLSVSNITDQAGNPVSPATVTLNDTDNDSMADAWEIAYFGTLENNGSGDSDGDGVSDLDEYLNRKNPTSSNAPCVPQIQSPEDQAEVTNLQPVLTLVNSVDPDNDSINYIFEVYADEGKTALVASDVNVIETEYTTSWTVPLSLADNSRYYWRVRATDGTGFSEWVYGPFFVNSQNDPPGAFHISSPQPDAEVDTLIPILEVTNSTDADWDIITYRFELYEDISLTVPAVSSPVISEGDDGVTAWWMDPSLRDNTWYYWRAVATDEHGAETQTLLGSFFVNTIYEAPDEPEILSPAIGSEVDVQALNLMVANAFDPEEDVLTYYFELDRVNTFDSGSKQSSGEISEGEINTTWNILSLEDNTRYFWRVKANDGYAESPWSVGQFFVNTADDSPSVPTLNNPGVGAWVETVTPRLTVNPSADPDNDTLSYRFEIYIDAALTILLSTGVSSTPELRTPSELTDNTWYYWRARAEDEHGASSAWMDTAFFFTNNEGVNDPPDMILLKPVSAQLTNGDSILIRWQDSDPDSDAVITLYYDTDSFNEDGTVIIGEIREDPENESDMYLWDTTALEDGTYYIYGTITDGMSGHTSYAPGAVTIDRTPPTATASPPGGSFSQWEQVTLSANESGGIYYTLDGTDPTLDSPRYTAPLYLKNPTTLKFIAVDTAGNQSDLVVKMYQFIPDPRPYRSGTHPYPAPPSPIP